MTQTPEQRAEAARERQRKARSRRRREAVEAGEAGGARRYPYVCPVCSEPLRTAGGRRRHIDLIHGGGDEPVTIEGGA